MADDPITDLVTTRQVELNKLRVSAETFKGPCMTCRWFRDHAYGRMTCAHPLLLATWLDPVKGVQSSHQSVACEQARKPEGICGVDGNLWEKRFPNYTAWLGLIILAILGLNALHSVMAHHAH